MKAKSMGWKEGHIIIVNHMIKQAPFIKIYPHSQKKSINTLHPKDYNPKVIVHKISHYNSQLIPINPNYRVI